MVASEQAELEQLHRALAASELLPLKAAARHVGLDRSALGARADRGELPALRVRRGTGHTWFFLDEWLDENLTGLDALKAALSALGDVVSLRDAGEHCRCAPQLLKARADRGDIRALRVRWGDGHTWFFLVEWLEKDVPRCLDCERFAPGPSGRCDDHHNELKRGVPRSLDVRAKIAAAQSGRPRPYARKYEDVERSCEWCGKSLGLVPGWKINSGMGRFCSREHAQRAQWAPGGVLADREILRRAELDAWKRSNGYFDTREVADWATLTPSGVLYYVHRRALRVERFEYGNRFVYVYAKLERTNWGRRLYRSTRDVRRRERLQRRLGGAPKAPPKPHEIRWADALPGAIADLTVQSLFGEPEPPSVWVACRVVACNDAKKHPGELGDDQVDDIAGGDWDGYERGPHGDLTRDAAELAAGRVYRAMQRKFPELLTRFSRS
jgi:hypothetical protein